MKAGVTVEKSAPFGDILPNEFVGILDQPFLPRAVLISKIYDYAIKSFGYQQMSRELAAINEKAVPLC